MPKEMKIIPLTQLESGESGIVTEILGGRGLITRLNSLGIFPGKKITKVSAMIMRGPVVVRIENMELALGFGMAKRILVSLRSTVDRPQERG